MNQRKYGALLSYTNVILTIVVNLGYAPLMIRLLGQNEFGIYSLVGSIVSYLGLFSLGFNGAYMRVFSIYKNRDDEQSIFKLNGMFMCIFIFLGILALISGAILSLYPEYLFGDKLSTDELSLATLLLHILIINIVLTFPASVFDAIVSSRECFVFQQGIVFLGTLFNPMLCLPLLLMGYGSIAVVSVITVITITKLFINAWYCLKRIKTRFIFGQFDGKLFRSIAGFSFFVFLNMIIDNVNWTLDKIILAHVVGAGAVAVYGVGGQLNTVYLNFSTVISRVFVPKVNIIANSANPNRFHELSVLVARVGRIQFMVTLYIFCCLVFAGKQFIAWWVGNEYIDTYYVALLLISPLVWILPKGLGVEIRRAFNKHRMATLIMLVTAIFNGVISIPLSMKWGTVGAAFGTWICLIINSCLMDVYFVKYVQLDIRIYYREIFMISLRIFPVVIIGLFGCYIETFYECIPFIIAYTILYAMVMYFFVMNEEEQKYIYEPVKKITGKWRVRK